MSRELKFRVWDILNKELIYHPNKQFSIRLNGEVVDGNGCMYDEIYPIQQYTGIKDKNDKEIYEGDIIKGHTSNDGQEVISIIEFSPARGWYIDSATAYFDELLYEGGVNLNDSEVIGNVFETPKLLLECDKPMSSLRSMKELRVDTGLSIE